MALLDDIKAQLRKEAQEIDNPHIHKLLRNQEYGIIHTKTFTLPDMDKVLETMKKARLLAATLENTNGKLKYMDTDSKL